MLSVGVFGISGKKREHPGGGDVRIDSGETVFQKRNVKNPMLRSMADWGIRDVEIEEPGKKNLLDARVSCGAPAAVSDMKD